MKIIVPVIALILLATTGAIAAKPHFTPSIGESARYRCADGRQIEILYSGSDVAVLTIGDTPLELARAGSEAEESYQGGGWRWIVAAARAGDLIREGGGATRCRVG